MSVNDPWPWENELETYGDEVVILHESLLTTCEEA